MHDLAIDNLAEATQIDFKEKLETRKAKSWLKTVSAFANGIGGTIVFGVKTTETGHQIVGVNNAQEVVAKLSKLLQARIKPNPQVEINVSFHEDKPLVLVKVNSGQATPYYYVHESTHTAFVRLGEESIAATE